MTTPWIAVDLDGTLAEYEGYKWEGYIGKPIPLMMERVKRWLDKGMKVKIFTARATDSGEIPYIKKWLSDNGLPDLEITNCKDYGMIELWDDKARRVEINTGEEIK